MSNFDEIQMFCKFLLAAYEDVRDQTKIFYVKVNDVRERLGISKELMEKRLTEIWNLQFKYVKFKYSLALEVDLTPADNWRLRNKKIFVNNIPANIMQFHERNSY